MTAIERKQNTEKMLETLGIPIPDELPPMEEENAVVLKTPQEIAARILVLTYLNCVAIEQDLRHPVVDFLQQNDLWEKVSEEEKKLFQSAQLTDEEIINIGWRGEAIWLLLWTINKVERLDLPADEVDLDNIFALVPGFMEDPGNFINSATIRSLSAILDQSDLIFRLSWVMRQTQPGGPNEMSLNQGVAHERYYAITWVTSVRHDWDDDI